MFQGVVTFRQATVEKVSFVLLALFDFILTLFALHLGLSEMNPIVRDMLASPFQFLLIKGIAPVFLAWLVPGRLLLPATGCLLLVAAWNIKELVLFFA